MYTDLVRTTPALALSIATLFALGSDGHAAARRIHVDDFEQTPAGRFPRGFQPRAPQR